MKLRRRGLLTATVIAVAVLATAGGWLALGDTAQAQTGLPAPANVQVVNGSSSGDVVVSWDEVAGASGYTVLWVNYDAAWDAYHSGHDWLRLTLSVDVQGGGTTTQMLTVSSPDTEAARYLFVVGSKSAPDADPVWSAWQSLTVRSAAASDVQALSAALAIATEASALDAVGSVATHSGMTPESIRQTAQQIGMHRAALQQQLGILAGSGQSDRVARIRTLVTRLLSNVGHIQAGRRPLGEALRSENASRAQLTLDNTTRLFPATDAVLDNQFYGLVTNADGGSAGSGNLSQNDVLRYTHTDSLSSNAALGHTLLLVASLMQDPTYVARIHERYDSVAGRIGRDVEYLRQNPVPGLGPGVLALAENVRDAGGGDGEDDYFDRLEQRLELTVAERRLIANNEKTLDQLLCELDALAAVVQGMQPAGTCAPDVEAAGVPGVTPNAIRFGQSAALTGPSSELGLGMQLGIQAAFNEANQAGGVNGRMLMLTSQDDGYETDRAFANTLALIESGHIFALIGAVGTPTSRAASPVAHDAGVPFIAPFTGAQLLRQPELTNILNLRASYHEEAEKMVAYLEREGKTRVAVLYQNDSYGIDGLNGVKQALEGRNMDLVASWYYRRNSAAVKSAVFRIAEGRPDAVIMVGTHLPTARAVEMLRSKLDPDPVFMAVSFVGSNALAEELGNAGQGVLVSQVVPLPSSDSIPVLAEYRAALAAHDPTAEPDFISLEGYLAGRLAIKGLELCGSNVTRACFLNAVQNAGAIDLSGFSVMFGPMDNQGSDADAVILSQIGPDGEYDAVD
ncbi:MAG: ABC transporter substrate-binding protein [Dehalococcoidia bacterium]|nr:ABC transporter substrate-binding protein [Dehalococcoidia bacterium]